MRAGTLRHLITIQSPTETNEATMGGLVQTWTDFAEVWADVQPVSGTERFISQQLLANVSHTIRTRYVSDLTPKMRAVMGQGSSQRVFNFESVINTGERGKETVITATEEVPKRA